MYNFYQTNLKATEIIQYISGYQAEIKKEYDTTSFSDKEIFLNYINKQIDAIDKARKEIRQKHPNLLPKIYE
ncbi:MAG: hypothetical protein RL769_806 [Pseudomonadota bacterium]|jgi:hypothetical protein